MSSIRIYRGRTARSTITLEYSVLGDIIRSQIRVAVNPTSKLIAEWDVDISPDGRRITLTLDDLVTKNIVESGGYMDIKRVTGGEPVPVLDYPLPVVIMNVVTE